MFPFSYVPWPSYCSNASNWWELSDNWETTVIFTTVFLQFITSAAVFTSGATFRQPVGHSNTHRPQVFHKCFTSAAVFTSVANFRQPVGY
jgi:hypothetical protein